MKGDAKVIEFLNAALRSELTAISQYWVHFRLQEDWGLAKMAKKSREESIEEMGHADKIIARILFLEGLLRDDLDETRASIWVRFYVAVSGMVSA